jgi:hypothetical protein
MIHHEKHHEAPGATHRDKRQGKLEVGHDRLSPPLIVEDVVQLSPRERARLFARPATGCVLKLVPRVDQQRFAQAPQAHDNAPYQRPL